MKKKLLLLSVFTLATTAMASATLKEEVNYNFKGTPKDVNVIKNDGSQDTSKQEYPLAGLHTPESVTSLNIDTDLVKADLSFLLNRNFKYTPSNVAKLDEGTKYRRVYNLEDEQTVRDLYGDAELTYKLNDNLTAKGFLHYNQNGIIKDKDIVKGAVKIGLDYDYSGVSGRGLLIALSPELNDNIWNGLSITAKTNINKFELTGDAFGLFDFHAGKITDSKKATEDSRGINLPKFYSEINLGAKYFDGALTSDNKLHYHSFISKNSYTSTSTSSNNEKVSSFELGEITKYMKDYKDGDVLPKLDLKYISENTYNYNDKLTLTGNATLEHKINDLTINTTTNSKTGIKYSKGVNKGADYIIDLKPGVKYEDQMNALKLTVTGDSEMSYDYNRKSNTTKADKLSYISYSDMHTVGIKPGAEAKAEYKVNDELTATSHLGIGTNFEYKKSNKYNIADPTKVEYNGDEVTLTQAFKPSLGVGLNYMNGPLTASLSGDISNTNTFTTIKSHDKDGKLSKDYSFERKFELKNKGTDINAKLDYKVNNQISTGAEASINMSLSNDRIDTYSKDNKLSVKGNETTIFQITDNGLDDDKKAKTFFSIYGSYMPMSSLTTTATAKVELETNRTRVDQFIKSGENFVSNGYTIKNQINELIPSFELKADYTILEGLKLEAKTSIGAKYGNEGYQYSYDKDAKATNVAGHEDDIKKAEKINFKELNYKLGLTLSYKW